MKTNQQIADECAHAAWSWLCEGYDIPIPRIQQIIKDHYYDQQPVGMPGYRVSLQHERSFYIPGIPASKPGEVVIAAGDLHWLPHCRTNNTIESWTLQFVGQFTRAIELQNNWKRSRAPLDVRLKAALNQIAFAREFFPHLCQKYKAELKEVIRRERADLRKSRLTEESKVRIEPRKRQVGTTHADPVTPQATGLEIPDAEEPG